VSLNTGTVATEGRAALSADKGARTGARAEALRPRGASFCAQMLAGPRNRTRGAHRARLGGDPPDAAPNCRRASARGGAEHGGQRAARGPPPEETESDFATTVEARW